MDTDSDSDGYSSGGSQASEPGEEERKYNLLPEIAHRHKRRRVQEEKDQALCTEVFPVNAHDYIDRCVSEDLAGCKLCKVIGVMEKTNAELERLLFVGSVEWEHERAAELCISERARFQYIAEAWNEKLLPELKDDCSVERRQLWATPQARDISHLQQWTETEVTRHFTRCVRPSGTRIIDAHIADFRAGYNALLENGVYYHDLRNPTRWKHDPEAMQTLLKVSKHIKDLLVASQRMKTQKK